MSRYIIAVFAASGFFAAAAFAQDRSGTRDAVPQQPNYSGQRNWLVIKGSLQDFTGKSDSILADFSAEHEAQAYAQKLNEQEKDWTRWTYTYRMRTQDERTASSAAEGTRRGDPIEIPKLKFVDIVPQKTDQKTVFSLKGKSGQGQIGKAKVTFAFNSDGTLRIRGELEGDGKWEQVGSGVSMRTALSTFRGRIDGDKVSGLRFVKDNSEPLTEWSVSVKQPNSAAAGRMNAMPSKGPLVIEMRTYFPDSGWGSWMNSSSYSAPYNDGKYNEALFHKKSFETLERAQTALKQQNYHHSQDARQIPNSGGFQYRIVDPSGKVLEKTTPVEGSDYMKRPIPVGPGD